MAPRRGRGKGYRSKPADIDVNRKTVEPERTESGKRVYRPPRRLYLSEKRQKADRK